MFYRVDNKYEIVRQMPLNSLIGYAISSSAYQTLVKSEPKTDVIHNLQSR